MRGAKNPGKYKVGQRNTGQIERAEGGKAMQNWDPNSPDRHLLSCSSSSTTGNSMVLWRMADSGRRPLDLGLTAIPCKGLGWKTVATQGHFHALLATSPSPPVSQAWPQNLSLLTRVSYRPPSLSFRPSSVVLVCATWVCSSIVSHWCAFLLPSPM